MKLRSKPTGKPFLAPGWLAKHIIPMGLRPSSIAVYLTLIQHAWESGEEPISQAMLASHCGGIATRTVRTAISKLESLRLITVERRGNKPAIFRVPWVSNQEAARQNAFLRDELHQLQKEEELNELRWVTTSALEEQLAADTLAKEAEQLDRQAEYHAQTQELASDLDAVVEYTSVDPIDLLPTDDAVVLRDAERWLPAHYLPGAAKHFAAAA